MPETETGTTENADTGAENGTDNGTDNNENTTDAKETADKGGDLGDGGKKALDAERDARKAAEKQLREAQKSLKEFEDRDKTELQKALERADAAEKRPEAAEFGSLRAKVAAAKGVPASSLTGKTEDELNASADELIAWRDQNTPPPPPERKRWATSTTNRSTPPWSPPLSTRHNAMVINARNPLLWNLMYPPLGDPDGSFVSHALVGKIAQDLSTDAAGPPLD